MSCTLCAVLQMQGAWVAGRARRVRAVARGGCGARCWRWRPGARAWAAPWAWRSARCPSYRPPMGRAPTSRTPTYAPYGTSATKPSSPSKLRPRLASRSVCHFYVGFANRVVDFSYQTTHLFGLSTDDGTARSFLATKPKKISRIFTTVVD